MISTSLAYRIALGSGLTALVALAALAFLPAGGCGAPSDIALELARTPGDLVTVFGSDAGCAAARTQILNMQTLIGSIAVLPAIGAFLFFFFLAMVPRDEYAAFAGFVLSAVAVVAAYAVNACLFLIAGAPGWALMLLPFAAAAKWLALGLAGAVGGLILLKAGRVNYPAALCAAAGLLGAVLAVANPHLFGALTMLLALPMLAFLIVCARHAFAPSDDATASAAVE